MRVLQKCLHSILIENIFPIIWQYIQYLYPLILYYQNYLQKISSLFEIHIPECIENQWHPPIAFHRIKTEFEILALHTDFASNCIARYSKRVDIHQNTRTLRGEKKTPLNMTWKKKITTCLNSHSYAKILYFQSRLTNYKVGYSQALITAVGASHSLLQSRVRYPIQINPPWKLFKNIRLPKQSRFPSLTNENVSKTPSGENFPKIREIPSL